MADIRLMVTNSGGGYSQWKGFDMTRWRADPALDRGGSYIYIKDVAFDRLFGPRPQQPFRAASG